MVTQSNEFKREKITKDAVHSDMHQKQKPSVSETQVQIGLPYVWFVSHLYLSISFISLRNLCPQSFEILNLYGESSVFIYSQGGRKFLIPSLSEGTTRVEKERFQMKKWASRPVGTKGLPDVSEGSELSSPTPDEEENNNGAAGYRALRMSSLVGEVHDWWGSQLELSSASDSDA